MKKSILSIVLIFVSAFVWADEGMWLMTFIERLKYSDWEKEGLHLTPDEIYSVNHASLKDAIVSFNGYCTGEVVSDQGLLFTNHHCGYEKIAELSTPEHDYLNNGFWAKSKDEELSANGLYVRFLVRMDNVTDRILKKLNDKMSEKERQDAIDAESKKIADENDENGKYTVVVKDFYAGNEFYYFVYQDYTDVRLVGTPPASIGKFGGTTDNWEWPRHTGDFSIFRIYADKDGNPADYSANNVPLTPKYSLPIRVSGVKPGDFSMTIGYPGSTDRYMSSYGIEQAIEVEYPAWVDAAGTARSTLKKEMEKSKKVSLDYASQYASIDNYWKNRIGMIEALNKLNTKGKKEKIEAQFTQWVMASPDRKAKYGNVLSNLKKCHEKSNDFVKNRTYISRGVISGSGIILKAYRLGALYDSYLQQTDDNKAMMLPKIKEELVSQYETFNADTEKSLLSAVLANYADNISDDLLSDEVRKIKNDYHGDFKAYVNKAMAESVFSDEKKVDDLFANANPNALKKDPIYILANSIIDSYRYMPEEQRTLEEVYAKNYRLFIEGLRKANPNKIYYPDANFTMRLSTGKVVSLPENPKRPSDSKDNYYTTLKGEMRKFLPNDEEWDLPTELIKLYNTGDYGQYADKDGSMHVCFLTDNDITGGNSGSPVIGGNGALIGIAFDGNWEAMSGDIEFEKNLQRTINVDIRYVLFIIDKYAGATNLIEELKLVE